MSSSWITRRYRPGDETKILELLGLCFGQSVASLEGWSWILKRNPLGFHGTEGDIWVAETSAGLLIGHYERIRVPMWHAGKSIVGSQVSSLCTHPDYRRQGVYDSLARSALEDAKKNEIGVSFSFPSELSYRGVVKHGWMDLGKMRDLAWVLDPEDFARRMRRTPVTKLFASVLLSAAAPELNGMRTGGGTGDVEIADGFMEDAGSVWDSLKHGYDVGIERTKAYLEWRYHRHWGDYQILSAMRGGQTAGYAVFRAAAPGSGRGRICELISKNDDVHVYQRLLKEVRRRSRAQGMIVLAASAACSPGHHAVLRHTRARILASIMKSVRYDRGHMVALFLQGGQRVQPGRVRWYHSIGDRDFG